MYTVAYDQYKVWRKKKTEGPIDVSYKNGSTVIKIPGFLLRFRLNSRWFMPLCKGHCNEYLVSTKIRQFQILFRRVASLPSSAVEPQSPCTVLSHYFSFSAQRRIMAILPPDPIYVLRGNTNPVHSLLFRCSPYIEHLYAGSEDGTVHVWDLMKNREIFKLSEIKEACMALYNVDDECLVTQRKGGILNFWKPNGSTWTLNNSHETDYYGFCRCKPNGKDIFIPLPHSRVGLFSLKTEKVECELDPAKLSESKTLGDVMAIKFVTQPSELLLVAYESGHLALWDMKVKDVLSWMKLDECPMTIEYENSLRHGVIGSPNDKLEVFEISKSQVFNQKVTLTVKNPGTSAIVTRPDAKVFTVGGWDGRLRIFSWKTLRPLAILDQHIETIYDIIYSTCKVETYNSKCLMAAAGKDGHISLWDLYN